MASRTSKPPFAEFVPRVHGLFEARRDPVVAQPMATYMRRQFPFLGIKAPAAGTLVRKAIAGLARPTQAELAVVAGGCWQLPEREYQYAGAFVLARYVAVCDASFLPVVQELIVTKSWWDTVDTLAVNVVGPLVSRNPGLRSVMDTWVSSDNIWLARAAILHQIKYRSRTDSARLFRYCLMRSAEQEFFIRKAIGWALREYSKTDATAVREFVAGHDAELSGLSKREALLWLNGRKVRQAGAEG